MKSVMFALLLLLISAPSFAQDDGIPAPMPETKHSEWEEERPDDQQFQPIPQFQPAPLNSRYYKPKKQKSKNNWFLNPPPSPVVSAFEHAGKAAVKAPVALAKETGKIIMNPNFQTGVALGAGAAAIGGMAIYENRQDRKYMNRQLNQPGFKGPDGWIYKRGFRDPYSGAWVPGSQTNPSDGFTTEWNMFPNE